MVLEVDLGCAVLRVLNPADAPSLAHHANDRRIWIQLRDIIPHPYREEDAVEFIERIHMQNQPTAFALEVDGQAVGVIGLTMQTDINRLSAEIGFWLGAAYWGKGITTAAVKALTSMEHGPTGSRPAVCYTICAQCEVLSCTGESRLHA